MTINYQNQKAGRHAPRLLYVVARAASVPGSPWTIWPVPENGAQAVADRLAGRGIYRDRSEAENRLEEVRERED